MIFTFVFAFDSDSREGVPRPSPERMRWIYMAASVSAPAGNEDVRAKGQRQRQKWIPAFAGMTAVDNSEREWLFQQPFPARVTPSLPGRVSSRISPQLPYPGFRPDGREFRARARVFPAIRGGRKWTGQFGMRRGERRRFDLQTLARVSPPAPAGRFLPHRSESSKWFNPPSSVGLNPEISVKLDKFR